MKKWIGVEIRDCIKILLAVALEKTGLFYKLAVEKRRLKELTGDVCIHGFLLAIFMMKTT